MSTTATMFVGYPGKILKEEYMNYHGISNEEMAEKTGIEVETMNGIVDGTLPMTAELSKKIVGFVKVHDDFFLSLQELFEEQLDPLELGIIETDNPTTMKEYNRQATILVAMSSLDNPKNERRRAEFSPFHLQIITFLVDHEVSIDDSPILEHEKHLHGPIDHEIDITIEHLVQEGFVEVKLPKSQKAWITQNGKCRRNANVRYYLNSYDMKLSKMLLFITEEQVNDIRTIVNKIMGMSVSQLKGCVFEKFPLLNRNTH